MIFFFSFNFFCGLVLLLSGLSLVEAHDITVALLGGMISTIGLLSMCAFAVAIHNRLGE